MSQQDKQGPASASLLLGLVLIALGVLFLLGQVLGSFFGIDLGHYLWPFFVLVPGALMLLFSVLTSSQFGEPLAILGGMVTMAGALLFFQNISGLWASWAYAWALVVPTGAGFGLLIYGFAKGQPDKVRNGRQLALTGLAIFVVAGLFFELVIGISGLRTGRYLWPLLLIALGLVMLVRTLLPRSR